MAWLKHEAESDFFKFEFGQSIVGVYVGKEESDKYPGTYNYKIDIENVGVKYISGAVIQSHFDDEKKPIAVGQKVRITYKGKTKNYHDYDIAVWVE